MVVNDDTAFVAGTRTFGDWLRNVNIVAGRTKMLPRYGELERVFHETQFKRVVGHSMGGSVALEFQRSHPEVESVTYGAPVVSFSSSSNRHRDVFDPVSMFDFGADSNHYTFPHAYKGK